MNRRLTILLPLVAVLAGAGCTTFSDNDAVARVGDVELSSTELRARADARGAPQGEALEADPVRREIAVWIGENVDPDAVAATYRDGLVASGSICLDVLVVETEESADAALAELRAGTAFPGLFDAQNIDPSLEAQRGRLGCLAAADLPFGTGNVFIDSLVELDAENPLIAIDLADNAGGPSAWAVARFVPYDELGPDETPTVLQSINVAELGLDVYVDPRYGTYDATTGAVVALG